MRILFDTTRTNTLDILEHGVVNAMKMRHMDGAITRARTERAEWNVRWWLAVRDGSNVMEA